LLSWARQEPQILVTVERLAKGAWEAEKMLIEGTEQGGHFQNIQNTQ